MAVKIAEIKNELKNAPIDRLASVIETYTSDERSGVQSAIASAQKRLDAYHKELARVEIMLTFEKSHPECRYICGIDEAGRGPLAGPVVAAAVILDPQKPILYVNDSKKLSEKKREALFDEIMEKALYVGVGIASPEVIDDINILQADYVAMTDAVHQLGVKPDLLLNDAVIIPQLKEIQQISIIKGDAKSLSIAAASIIAKVTRDRMMYQYDEMFPEYGFAKNKGYGTADHIAALKAIGPTPIHRRSFIGNFVEL